MSTGSSRITQKYVQIIICIIILSAKSMLGLGELTISTTICWSQKDIFTQARDCLLPMGITSENVAQRFGVTREEQDQAAVSFLHCC